jgi:hypothetical protein
MGHDLQCVLEMLINLHDRCLIAAAVAVVGRTEDGDNIPVLTPVVALHNQLMRSCHQGQAIVVIEGLGNVLTKGVACTSWTDTPSTTVIRVTPQQITHGTLMRHLLDSVERSDVVKGIDTGRKTAVKAEDLVVDEGGQGKVVEEICEVFPDIGVSVLAQALVVEAVDLCDLSRFVIATKNGDAGRISDLQSNEQCDSLDRIIASIDVVAWRVLVDLTDSRRGSGHTHEKVVCIWVRTADAEQLHQVVKLAVDVAADRDWAFLGTCQCCFVC